VGFPKTGGPGADQMQSAFSMTFDETGFFQDAQML
jgi:hypothetical protein